MLWCVFFLALATSGVSSRYFADQFLATFSSPPLTVNVEPRSLDITTLAPSLLQMCSQRTGLGYIGTD